jgi:hypothetical protein
MAWLSEVQIFLSKVGLRPVSWQLKIARAFVHFQSGTRWKIGAYHFRQIAIRLLAASMRAAISSDRSIVKWACDVAEKYR